MCFYLRVESEILKQASIKFLKTNEIPHFNRKMFKIPVTTNKIHFK